MTDVLLVFTHCPDDASADRIARALVQNQLAACVNRHGPVSSVYRWQGAVEQAAEVALVIKTTRDAYRAVEEAIRQMHPYDVPEIVAVPAEAGSAQYLRWIRESVAAPAPTYRA